jgi:hypothetical protein
LIKDNVGVGWGVEEAGSQSHEVGWRFSGYGYDYIAIWVYEGHLRKLLACWEGYFI